MQKNFNIVSEETIFIINYFRHNKNLLKLIWNPLLDKILRELIDQDYVLAASNLINKTFLIIRFLMMQQVRAKIGTQIQELLEVTDWQKVLVIKS